MAHHRDAKKRILQAEKARVRNQHYTSRMRNQLKKLREVIARGDHAAAQAELNITVSVIQATAQKGVIHKNQADRRVSRLMHQVNALRTPAAS